MIATSFCRSSGEVFRRAIGIATKPKGGNFFAGIQRCPELWRYHMRLDAIWLREFDDLGEAKDPGQQRDDPLAEDRDGLREVTQEVLESFGYRVLLARNGEEALEVFAESHRSVFLA
jgi:hypothetical protein